MADWPDCAAKFINRSRSRLVIAAFRFSAASEQLEERLYDSKREEQMRSHLPETKWAAAARVIQNSFAGKVTWASQDSYLRRQSHRSKIATERASNWEAIKRFDLNCPAIPHQIVRRYTGGAELPGGDTRCWGRSGDELEAPAGGMELQRWILLLKTQLPWRYMSVWMMDSRIC